MIRRRSRRSLLAVLLLVVLVACKEDLYSGLSEREANEIVAVLARYGIAADRAADTKTRRMTVRVERARFADAVEILKAHGLPRETFASIGDVFRAEGLVTSPLEERARLTHAINQELARTISEIDGVQAARVHIVLPETDALRQVVNPAAASVFVRHDPDVSLAEYVPQIKTLVANAVAGLSFDRVSVVLIPALRQPPPAPVGPLPAVPGLFGDVGRIVAPLVLGGLVAAGIGLFVVGRRRRGEVMK